MRISGVDYDCGANDEIDAEVPRGEIISLG